MEDRYEQDRLELGERPAAGLVLENAPEEWLREGVIWARASDYGRAE